MRISHSAKELFESCPRSYKLKYIDKYRPKTLSSALFFGTAFGDAVQAMILDKKQVLTPEEVKLSKMSPEALFLDLISFVDINGVRVSIPKSPLITYFKSDYDPLVLEPQDIEEIKKYRAELGIEDFIDMDFLQTENKAGNLDQDEIKLLNFAYWNSVRRRGLALIEVYRKEIYPRIKRVYEIEGKINIENAEGDVIVGYLDLVCDFECDDGEVRKILFDHKTSSKKYPKNAIFDKKQLLLYNYDREIDLLGYIIGLKKLKNPKIGKRKGEKYFEIQVMIGETNSEAEEEVIGEYDWVLNEIKEGNFPKTQDKNKCKFNFGKPCDYYDICHNNDDSKLFKKESK